MAVVPTTSVSPETTSAVAATASGGVGAASRPVELAEPDVGATGGSRSEMDARLSFHRPIRRAW